MMTGGRASFALTPTEQASSAVSRARRRIPAGLRLGDLADFRHEMAEQVLDAVLERRGRGGATGAGAAHVQENNAVAEAAEGDVAAVLGDGRTDPGLEQLLDGRHR